MLASCEKPRRGSKNSKRTRSQAGSTTPGQANDCTDMGLSRATESRVASNNSEPVIPKAKNGLPEHVDDRAGSERPVVANSVEGDVEPQHTKLRSDGVLPKTAGSGAGSRKPARRVPETGRAEPGQAEDRIGREEPSLAKSRQSSRRPGQALLCKDAATSNWVTSAAERAKPARILHRSRGAEPIRAGCFVERDKPDVERPDANVAEFGHPSDFNDAVEARWVMSGMNEVGSGLVLPDILTNTPVCAHCCNGVISPGCKESGASVENAK